MEGFRWNFFHLSRAFKLDSSCLTQGEAYDPVALTKFSHETGVGSITSRLFFALTRINYFIDQDRKEEGCFSQQKLILTVHHNKEEEKLYN